MDEIEYLRDQLHKALETDNAENVLRISCELDKVIYVYMQKNTSLKRKSA